MPAVSARASAAFDSRAEATFWHVVRSFIAEPAVNVSMPQAKPPSQATGAWRFLGSSRAVKDWFTGAPAPPPPHSVPLAALTAWSVFGLFLIALFVVMHLAQVVLLPAVAAAVVAVIFSPVMSWFERRGLPSGVSAFLILVGLLATLAGVGVAVAPTVRDLSVRLPQMAARIDFKLADIRATWKSISEAREQIDKATEVGTDQKPKVAVDPPGTPGGGIGEVLFQIGLFAVLTYFFMVSRRHYRRRVIMVQATQPERLRVARIVRDMSKRVSAYLFTVSMINVGLGIVTGAALAAIGLPSAVLLGFLIAIFNFVPFIGPILVIAATAVLALATFDSWTLIIAAPAIMLSFHLVESQFVSPWLVGRRLEMSPLAVFGGIAFLGWMWGAVGAMVAVPVLILLYTFGQHIPVLAPLARWIGPTEGIDEDEEDADEAKPAAATATAPAPEAPAPPAAMAATATVQTADAGPGYGGAGLMTPTSASPA